MSSSGLSQNSIAKMSQNEFVALAFSHLFTPNITKILLDSIIVDYLEYVSKKEPSEFVEWWTRSLDISG